MMQGLIMRVLMRPLAMALAALLLGAPAPSTAGATPTPAESALPDAALPDAEWQAIKVTINEQLAALKSGDGPKAFAQASPSIRQQFGTAADFLSMVRAAYGALIAAR